MADEDFEAQAGDWLGPADGAAGPGRYGISYWSRNLPTRLFNSWQELERARLEFLAGKGRGLNLIRLARETKYYVDGKNVPNRV